MNTSRTDGLNLDSFTVFNYARSDKALPSADTIPTLIPKRIMDELTNGDPAPFFRVEVIDLPAKGSGGVYEKTFFESYLNVMKTRPIPGSKRGHESASRPSNDFYTVGGRVDANQDGKTGTCCLKVYIPPRGDTTDNAGFIRDARAGLVHFSIVSSPEFSMKMDTGGEYVRHFTASKGFERNDAVEYGAGAMDQVVNSGGAPTMDPAFMKVVNEVEAASRGLANVAYILRMVAAQGSPSPQVFAKSAAEHTRRLSEKILQSGGTDYGVIREPLTCASQYGIPTHRRGVGPVLEV